MRTRPTDAVCARASALAYTPSNLVAPQCPPEGFTRYPLHHYARCHALTENAQQRAPQTHNDDSEELTASAKAPPWKHQPALLGMFLVECKSYLPGLDSRYRSMITRRTHTLRGKTCVDGKAHLLCHRDGLLDNVWSWESPAPTDVVADGVLLHALPPLATLRQAHALPLG